MNILKANPANVQIIRGGKTARFTPDCEKVPDMNKADVALTLRKPVRKRFRALLEWAMEKMK